MNSLFSLEGKVAMVTGASRWTGKAIAVEMAKAGADVAVCARTADAIEATAREIGGLGRRSIGVEMDVRSSDQVNGFVRRCAEELGRIDILVNNVGGSFFAQALELSERGWDAMIRQNLKPAFICSKAVAGIMIRQGGGCIINIASLSGLRADPTNPGYGAAKAGIISLTMTLAVEWAQYNIRVNAIAPGFIDVGSLAEAFKQAPGLRAKYEGIPLGRPARLAEIAGTAIYLASEAGGYTTGATIVVDGGLIAQMGC